MSFGRGIVPPPKRLKVFTMALAPGFLTALLAAFARNAARVLRALGHRRDAKALLEWDDRALKDIGLTRGDVIGALSRSWHQDPTECLAERTGTRPARATQPTGAPPKADANRPESGELPSALPA